MSKKILFLVDKFYPNVNANTVCCENIARYFKEQGDVVDFLSIKNGLDCETYAVHEGSNVIKVDTYCTKFLEKNAQYGVRAWIELPEKVKKIEYIKKRIRYFYRPSTRCSDLDFLDYKEVHQTIANISIHYDLIVSICWPFALHVLAGELMKKGLADKWFAVFLDAFEFNGVQPIEKTNYRKRLAQKVLRRADKIFFVDGLLQDFKERDYRPTYFDKIEEINLPMIQDLDLSKAQPVDPNKITLTYAGMFYRDIRNPRKMLKILSRLPESMKIRLFGNGCQDVVAEMAKSFHPGQLSVNGSITRQQCLEEIARSNVLINLGNTVTNQMPSKVFEYVSLGKPIINFYFTKDDMCLKVFNRYPLVFNIDVNNYTDVDTEALIAFIEKNKDTQLNYEEATANLTDYKADEVAKKIYRYLFA